MSSQSSPDDEWIGPTWVVTELIVWRLSESDVNMQPTLLIIQTPNKQNLANSQFEIM